MRVLVDGNRHPVRAAGLAEDDMADTPIDWQSNPFTAFLQSAAGDAWRSALVQQSERFWEAQRKMLDEYESLSRTLLGRRRAATEAMLDTMRKLGACRDNAEWSQCCGDWIAGSVARVAADSRDLFEESLKMVSEMAQAMSPGTSDEAEKTAPAREGTAARGAAIAQTAAAMQEAAARAGKAPPRFRKPDEGEPLGAGTAS
jgi:hypothetical protein